MNYDVGGSLSTATSVGAQFYERTREEFTNLGQDFASPLSRTINQASISSSEINYTFVENKSAGFYIQEQLSFSDRLFLTGAVRWDDPDIGIDWGIAGEAVLSDKDAAAPLLADFDSPFTYAGA